MRTNMKNRTWISLAAMILTAVLVSTADAADLTNSYALLVQQSPAEAGSVTPDSGVHSVQIGDTVSLTATPRPGYRFLYWLGDVSAADMANTSIQVDSPKMVVAVFTREAYEEELPGVSLIRSAASAGGGGGGGRTIGTPMSSPASVNPGSYVDYPDYPDYSVNYPTEEPQSQTFVPGDQIPEPATVLLLGLGATALLKRKK